MSMAMKKWQVQLFIDEHDGSTHAEARLLPDGVVTLVGKGKATLAPGDHKVPEIGDEIAAARALFELAHRLMEAAATDIEQFTHRSAHLE